MKNKEKAMIFVVFGSVLLIMISISYAYFTANFQNLGDRETSITAATMGSLKLTASAPTYTSGNQYPGDMAIQKFTIEPVTKGVGVYEIDLEGVLPSVFGSDVEVKLYKVLDNSEITITEGELTVEEYHPCSNPYFEANYELEKTNPSFLITSSQGDVSLSMINGEDGVICDEGYEGYGADDVITKYSRIDTLNENGNTAVYNEIFINGNQILLQEEFEVIEDNGTLKIRENSTSTSYPKYTFYLVYNYKNNGLQDAQMEQSFSGTVSGKIIQEKTFDPVNGADYIINLAKAGKIPLIVYDETQNSAAFSTSARNNFVYFNNQMPASAGGYVLYADHFAVDGAAFDTLEECNQSILEAHLFIDGTIECKYNNETNKYDVEIIGYILTDIYSTAEECDLKVQSDYSDEDGVSCRFYQYLGWRIAMFNDGKLVLRYLGVNAPELSSEADSMVVRQDSAYGGGVAVELNPNTLIVGGNGSKEKPYLLALEDSQVETGQG